MLGLRVNVSKCSLISIEEVPNLHFLASFFGCEVSVLPSTYLGLPLGASFKSIAVWDLVVERFQKRLARWKSRMLSKGGKLMLLQSTLWSLPIYYMSLFTIPASVASLLEKIMRDFPWSKHEGNNGFHWVCWDEICRPKEDGGLGIRSIRSMNEALKTKWLWRFASKDDALWKRVIVSKYGTGGVRRALFLIGSGVGNLFILLWIFASLSSVLRWEMVLGCCFGWTSGVGINHSSLNSQTFLGWILERCHFLEWECAFLEYHVYKKPK